MEQKSFPYNQYGNVIYFFVSRQIERQTDISGCFEIGKKASLIKITHVTNMLNIFNRGELA